MKVTPFEPLEITGALPERAIPPSVSEMLAGRKRISGMTADEYLQLVREAQKALAYRRGSKGQK